MLARLLKDRRGASAVEYALLIALVALAGILAMRSLGGEVGNTFNTIESNLAASSATRFDTP